MSLQLPINKQWVQNNQSDVLLNTYAEQNSLWATFNCDPIINKSTIRPTRLLQTTTSVTNTSMTDVPVAITTFGDSVKGVFCISGAFIHRSSEMDNAFTKYTTISGYPTTCDYNSDLAVFNGYLYTVGNDSKAYYTDGSAWHNFSVLAGTGSTQRMLCTYANRLYCVSQSNGRIISWDTSNTVVSDPTSQYCYSYDANALGVKQVRFMRAAEDKIWIGIGPSNGYQGTFKRGEIHEWDGSSNQATTIHILDATPMACIIKDNIPYIIDSLGRLLKYNGGGTFTELARLPLDNYMLADSYATGNYAWINANGIDIVNGKINFVINANLNNSTIAASQIVSERCPSGVWEYDEKIGLYHKYSFSQTALNGTQYDWGASRIKQAGALAQIKSDNSGNGGSYVGDMLVGGAIFTDATTANYGIWTNETRNSYYGTPQQKLGYFVTTKIPSQNITDIWNSLYIKYHRLLDSADKIVVKYRMDDILPTTNLTITWVAQNGFTVTTSSVSNYAVGDEVEIITGTGAGLCAHITLMEDNSGTTTIALDENAIGATTGTALARFQHWKKLGSVSDITSSWKKMTMPISATSTWVQFKVMMMFTNPKLEVEELDIKSSVSQSLA